MSVLSTWTTSKTSRKLPMFNLKSDSGCNYFKCTLLSAAGRSRVSATLNQSVPSTRSRRKGQRFHASMQSGNQMLDVKHLKEQIASHSGVKNGLDRSLDEAEKMANLIKELEATGALQDIDLTGTTWRLLYTSSTASSSGKIGPFIGRVSQVFPQERRGQYINKVDFGLLKADLLANYKMPAPDRINVAFEHIDWQLGPLHIKQDISQGRPDTSGGFWKLTYTDEDFRVLYTNRGNVFVLVRD